MLDLDFKLFLNDFCLELRVLFFIFEVLLFVLDLHLRTETDEHVLFLEGLEVIGVEVTEIEFLQIEFLMGFHEIE
jgi:hypothetical protein